VAVLGVLADVRAEEHCHVVDVVQPIIPKGIRAELAKTLASYARIHVM
jgi:hypothetical protein